MKPIPHSVTRSAMLDQLARHILAEPCLQPLRVAIDGVDASGKTTLAAELAARLPEMDSARPVIQASIDHFHNPREVRYRQGEDSAQGYYEDAFNLAALRDHLLKPLGPSGSRTIRTGLFDYRADTELAAETRHAPENAILLVDGVFLQRPELAGLWELVIYVQVSVETVFSRVIERDLPLFGSREAVINRYQRRYLPAHELYRQQCRPAEHAHALIINDDPTNPILLW